MVFSKLFNRRGSRMLAGLVMFVAFSLSFGAIQNNAHVYAASNPTPVPRVSFTFDDGFETFLTEAAPALATYGYSATGYITTGFIGTPSYLTWGQVTTLQNTYKWEIGSHSATHPLMTEITAAQLENEVLQSKQILQAHGLNPTSFATPFGDYNSAVEAAIAKYYDNHRPFHDTEGVNAWPYSDYLVQVRQVQSGVSVNQVKAYIDEAKATNTWLILVFHDVKKTPSTDPEDYEYATADLVAIAAYVQSQGIEVKNMSESFVKSTDNQVPNSDFAHGLSDGWNTDNPQNVTADTNGNGNNPDPTNSIKIVADTTKNVQLFSPQIVVMPDRRYVLKSYVNVTSSIKQGGEVAIYIDEYDANGNWVSGQYLGSIKNAEMKSLNFAYNLTSELVKKVRIQFIVTANSGITAYIDSVELFVVEPNAVQPPVDPNPVDPQPPVADVEVNLLDNSGFENGLSSGWNTDSDSNVTTDTNSNGGLEATHSIKMVANASKNVHLFSAITEVISAEQHTIKAHVNIPVAFTNGEVALYIDEYDINGNWVSGRYLGAIRDYRQRDMEFAYTPSSGVAKIRLQVIVTAGSGITAYVDDVKVTVVRPNPTAPTIPEEPETPPVQPEEPTQPEQSPTTPSNLLPNSDFSGGLSSGWTTDSSTVIVAENGAINFGAYQTTQHAHLFAPAISIMSGATYKVGADLTINTLQSGEVAIYIDEYDANGNWISGQYLRGVNAVGTQTLLLDYKPTSVNVAKAGLQFIVVGASGITGKLDNAQWRIA